MEDDKFQCILKTVGDAARVAVLLNLIARVTKIMRKRLKRSDSDDK
jgi:hypothetical protein